jgi:hypothetical protein
MTKSGDAQNDIVKLVDEQIIKKLMEKANQFYTTAAKKKMKLELMLPEPLKNPTQNKPPEFEAAHVEDFEALGVKAVAQHEKKTTARNAYLDSGLGVQGELMHAKHPAVCDGKEATDLKECANSYSSLATAWTSGLDECQNADKDARDASEEAIELTGLFQIKYCSMMQDLRTRCKQWLDNIFSAYDAAESAHNEAVQWYSSAGNIYVAARKINCICEKNIDECNGYSPSKQDINPNTTSPEKPVLGCDANLPTEQFKSVLPDKPDEMCQKLDTAYNYTDIGPGFCLVETGGLPQKLEYLRNKADGCEDLCSGIPSCDAYSVSDSQSCILFNEKISKSGGESWGASPRCLKKNKS